MNEFHLKRGSLTLDSEDRVSVDRTGFGRINGVSVITSGPALGHGIDIDGQTVESVTSALEGKPANWTHGNACDDALGKHLGQWTNPVTQNFVDPDGNDRVRTLADFVFAESAHSIAPDGLMVSAAEYLMQRAEEDPTTLGISIVANLDLEEVEEGDPLARLLEVDDLNRADFVGNPAANEFGLSAGIFTGTPSELAEKATAKVERMVAKFGRPKVVSFLEKALDAKIVELNTLTSLRTEIASLKLENKNLKEAALEAREAEVEEFLVALKVQAAEANSPIAPADLETVRELFVLGKDDLARSAGNALLKGAGAEPKFKVNVDGSLIPQDEDPRVRSVKAQVAMHRSVGDEVTVSEDGLSFTVHPRKK